MNLEWIEYVSGDVHSITSPLLYIPEIVSLV